MDRFEVPLGELIEVKHGYAFPGEGFGADPAMPVVVTPGNFSIGGGFREAKLKTFSGEYPSQFELQPGDLLVTMTDLSRNGDTLGLPALVPSRGRYLHNQRIGLVIVKDVEKLHPKFLAYYLRTSRYRSHVLGTATGSTVRHTSPSRICAFVADIPAIAEQRAIAEVLGALDDKIAANRRTSRISRELATAMFMKLAQGGEVHRIASVAALVTRGGAPKYCDDGLTVLNQKCVRNQAVNLEPARKTAPLKSRLDRMLCKNDVLVNSTGQGTLGRVARWTHEVDATVDSHITIVRFDAALVDPICAGFAMLGLESSIEGLAEGSTGQTELRRELLLGIDLRLPKKSDQTELGQVLDTYDTLERSLAKESQALAKTRDELLPLLMSGKLRIKDAEQIVEKTA